MSQTITIHIFRARHFAKSETVVTEGLEAAFGGSAYYRDEAAEEAYPVVWGARNGSRVPRQLGESGATLETVSGEPPACGFLRSKLFIFLYRKIGIALPASLFDDNPRYSRSVLQQLTYFKSQSYRSMLLIQPVSLKLGGDSELF
ncbi:MAG: hypothetical protein EOS07_31570 [Mesorhizobium sp.]|nr:MAG: hypothetical protein EOS07_31570 [Mesorhizobium sp.]